MIKPIQVPYKKGTVSKWKLVKESHQRRRRRSSSRKRRCNRAESQTHPSQTAGAARISR